MFSEDSISQIYAPLLSFHVSDIMTIQITEQCLTLQ